MDKIHKSTVRIALLLAFLLSFLPINGKQILFTVPRGTARLGGNSVTGIVQDKTGFMWVATHTCLFRYDGYRLREYLTPYKDAAYQGFEKLFIDAGDHLWAQNYNNTFLYSKEQDALTLQGDSLLQTMGIIGEARNLLFDQEYNLWCQQQHTLYYYNYQKKHLARISKVDADIFQVAARGAYQMALAKDGTLYRIAGGRLSPLMHLDLFSNTNCYMFIDSKCRLWLSVDPMSSHIYCISLPEGRQLSVSSLLPIDSQDCIEGMGESADGDLWIASHNEGVMVIDAASGECTRCEVDFANANSLPTNRLSSIYVHRGIVWIGTENHGMVSTNISNQKFARVAMPELTTINALLRDSDDCLWVGYESMGLRCFRPDGSSRLYNAHDGLPCNTITYALLDRSHRRWFCSYGGGIFYEKDGRFVTPKSLQGKKELSLVAGAVFDNRDNLWMATSDHGVYCMSPQGRLRHFDTSNTHINTNFLNTIAFNPHNGLLYVGTSIGLFLLRPQKGSISLLNLSSTEGKEAEAKPIINTLFVDRHGNTWIGTNHGIKVLDTNNRVIARLVEKDGLSSMEVKSILADHCGHVWVGGSTGYSCVNLSAKGLPQSAVAFGSVDGIHTIVPSRNAIALTRRGDVLMGSENFYLRISREAVTSTSQDAHVVFTQLMVEGLPDQSLAGVEGITLPHSNTNFTIEVSALDFDGSAPTVFRYRLSKDDRWVIMSSNSIEFNRLSAGDYNVEVQCRQKDGSFGSSAFLRLKMLPPWWWSTLAKVIYLLLAVAVAAYIFVFFRRRQRLALLTQREELEKEQQKNIEEAQMRILTNMVDDSLLRNINEFMALHISDIDYSVEQLSQDLKMSRSGLYKKLISMTGKTPLEYIHILRVKRGKEVIDAGESSVSQVAYQVGLSPKQFAKYYKDIYGMLPSDYMKEKNKGLESTK